MVKVILVTGGNRGIGLEICRILAAAGHKVILGSRDLQKGQKAGDMLKGKVETIHLDVINAGHIQVVASFIAKAYGKLDILINNAGIGIGSKGASDADLDDVKQIMETNFYGAWYVSQAMIPLLRKSNDGRIINMSSGMGALNDLTGGYAGYRLSKTALNGLTILMASELNQEEIIVVAMSPGWVRTDMGGAGAPRTVEQGAETAVWLATASRADIETGKFYRDMKIISW